MCSQSIPKTNIFLGEVPQTPLPLWEGTPSHTQPGALLRTFATLRCFAAALRAALHTSSVRSWIRPCHVCCKMSHDDPRYMVYITKIIIRLI